MKNIHIFKKTLSVIIAGALTGVLLTGCGSSQTQTNSDEENLKNLRVAIMTGQPDQYAVYIGLEQGIFQKYGIDITSTEFVAGINTIDAVVNGTADIGEMADYATVNRIGNTQHDTNLVLYSEQAINVPKTGGLYVAPEYADDISKLNGSAGFITMIGTVSEYMNWQAITYLGLDPSKQNIVQTDSNQTSLALVKNNSASASMAQGANASYYEEYGWKLVATSEQIGIEVGSYLLTTSDFLSANTELLANYLKALNESFEYITENIDDVSIKVSEKFGVKADDFKSDWSTYTFKVGFTEEGAQHLDDINAWALSHGKYSEAYNIRDFIDTSAAEIAVPNNVTINK